MPHQLAKSPYWPQTKHDQHGSIRHTHALARKGIAKVFELLGGEHGLWQWAMADDKNKFAFYTILLPKLIPAEISDALKSGDNRIQVVIVPPEHSQSQVQPIAEQDTAVVSTTNHIQQEQAPGASSAAGRLNEDSEA